MAHARVTEVDHLLPHQIRLEFQQPAGAILLVHCSCKSEPLGQIYVHESPWPVFNDRKNHNEDRCGFIPNVKNWKVYDV